jgi:hypothetical protein
LFTKLFVLVGTMNSGFLRDVIGPTNPGPMKRIGVCNDPNIVVDISADRPPLKLDLIHSPMQQTGGMVNIGHLGRHYRSSTFALQTVFEHQILEIR